ncbi:hypothetical protein PBY51_014062 [Eleginops maclovinus]|uniref:Chemokine interleukin-8-like domain-containing protein n=1 Tax=Eleginops maclovinus TaxID=56733 RepID=A0AAN7WVY2_ELEMC|nr:hypothetical protein PBY51_014062 [Eleginops maclovinus]
MSTTLSVCRLIFLLTLAVVMILSESQAVGAQGQRIPCLRNCTSKRIHKIQSCYEQMPRRNCNHAFRVRNHAGIHCIKADTLWLKKMIKENLRCPPDISS